MVLDQLDRGNNKNALNGLNPLDYRGQAVRYLLVTFFIIVTINLNLTFLLINDENFLFVENLLVMF